MEESTGRAAEGKVNGPLPARLWQFALVTSIVAMAIATFIHGWATTATALVVLLVYADPKGTASFRKAIGTVVSRKLGPSQ